MPDWKEHVRRHLPALPCPPEREAEIVEELAAQLEEVFRAERAAGAPEEQAAARAASEVSDWAGLAADIAAADLPLAARAARELAVRVEPKAVRTAPGRAGVGVFRELSYAARSLRRSPLFTTVAILTLALGIGATTAIFSVVNGVLLSPLAFREAGRLAVVQETVPELRDRYPVLPANPRSILAWQAGCRTACQAIAALDGTRSALTGMGDPELLRGASVSPGLLDLLGVATALGRPFRPEEAAAGHDRVVILSHGLWQRRFGGDPGVIGRPVTLDGNPFEVVGVLPAALRFPTLESLSPIPMVTGEPEFLVPLAFSDDERRSPGEYDYAAIVRLAPGATLAAAQAELLAITDAEFRSEDVHPAPLVRALSDQVVGRSRRTLWLLLGAVGTMLLVACVDLTHLLASRWQGRRRELAVRTAVGAGAGDLLRHVLAEILLLAAVGGGLGVTLAVLGLRAFVAAAPVDIPRLAEVAVDTRALAFTAFLVLATTLLCGLIPALRVAGTDGAETLKAGAHALTESSRWAKARSALIALETALTTALVVLGGLLLTSFQRVAGVERGFAVDRVLAFDLALPQARYPAAVDRAVFLDRLLASLRAAPGIEAAGLASRLPLEGERSVDALVALGDPRPPSRQPMANHLQVSPDYFRTMGIALLRGRMLSEADAGRRLALVSERTARTVWPGRDPLGQRFTRTNPGRVWEVVGVVADARIHGLEREAGLVAYVPYWDATTRDLSVVVRSGADPRHAATSLREVVRGLDSELPLQNLRTMESVVEAAVAGRRFQALLTAAFAVAGLLLASVGVYGVVAASVERRRPELAVRLAVGATPAEVVRLVVSQGLRPVMAGVTLGAAAAVGVGFALRALLFGVAPHDPLVIAAASLLVVVVAGLACLIPAGRASRTSPLLALRGS